MEAGRKVILEGKHVMMHFGALAALSGVDFSLREGEILGLIGPNGSGKTTLFNVITGVYRPTKGKILYKGRDISGMSPHKICRMGIAKTSQIVQPFTRMTVAENVLVGAMYGGGMAQKEAWEKRGRFWSLFTWIGWRMSFRETSVSRIGGVWNWPGRWRHRPR